MYQQTKPRNTFKELYNIINKGLSQRYKHFSVSGKQSLWLHHINKLKNRIHMIILINTEKKKKKTFDKAQHPFLIKTLQNVVIERMYFNKIQAIYDKLTTNVVLETEKLKTFSLLSRTRQEYSFLLLVFKIVLEVLAIAFRKGKEEKRFKSRKEVVKLSLFVDDIILYIEIIKMPPKTLLEFPNESSKVAEHNINIQKFAACLCTNSEVSERKKER